LREGIKLGFRALKFVANVVFFRIEYITSMMKKFFELPEISRNFIDKRDCFMLFETSLFDDSNSRSYIFTDPIDTIKVNRFQDIERAFAKIEDLSKRYYLAGYFSYELGYCFERASFRSSDSFPYPLINLYVFEKAAAFDHKTGKVSLGLPGLFTKNSGNRDFHIENLKINFGKQEYSRKISGIKKHIINGDTYQANFTGKYMFNFSGDAFSLYRDLKERQNVPYGAFCKLKSEYILSLSPELFFRRTGSLIYSKPMKGTIERGKNIYEDKSKAQILRRNVKESAGNIMIVDLIRNDLGKISTSGSVNVSSLFEIERYNTLFQMTSTVSSSLKKEATYFDIFKGLFPGGSVTGAPKIRTMQILKELEKGDRKIYCGALGMIFPGKKAVFNLPIRTISIICGKGEMGVGGGITVDSNADEEYRECLLKARFLTERYKPLSLIETILWNGKYEFLEEHFKRMSDSAEYFGFAFDLRNISRCLKEAEKKFNGTFSYRIRLLLAKDGRITFETSVIEKNISRKTQSAVLSNLRTDPDDVFLYHKTTNRDLYDAEYKRCRDKGFFDVIFLNTKGEVTEGAISNVVIKKNKKIYTPPLSSGLLPGIFRAHLLKNRRVEEKKIFPDDLRKADKIFLCNSVRGLIEVKI